MANIWIVIALEYALISDRTQPKLITILIALIYFTWLIWVLTLMKSKRQPPSWYA